MVPFTASLLSPFMAVPIVVVAVAIALDLPF